jgi:hypothetical protein
VKKVFSQKWMYWGCYNDRVFKKCGVVMVITVEKPGVGG